MKDTDIAKIRQFAFEIRSIADNDEPKQTKGKPEPCFLKMKRLADQILTLLPCETCNGTGKKPWTIADQSDLEDDLNYGVVKQEEPCPDCQL